MKIAIICDSVDRGGISTYTSQLAQALERLGHNVDRLESWRLDKHTLADYDVINAHTLWRLGRFSHMPLVFSGHGYVFLLFDKHQPLRSRYRVYNIWSYLSAKLHRRIIRASTAVNRLAAAVIEKDLGIKVDAVIRPGIDTLAFNTNVSPLELDGYPKLIYAGPVTHRKNLEELFHIVKNLKRHYPNPTLRILGWVASSDYKERLVRLQESLGLEKTISFDFVPREMVPRYIRSSDIYISASRVDWTPMSVYEAIACGVPILLSDIPAHKEMIEETGGGETYHLEDLGSAVTKIQEILSNTDMYRNRSKQFVSTASWDDKAKQFVDVYRKAVKDKNEN